MKKALWLSVATVLGSCASTPEDPNLVPVPVYETQEQVPCEYEVIERVRVRSPTGAPTFDEFVRRLRVNHGRAGARVGADAVIAEMPSSGVARRREVGSPPPVPTGPPPGRAIRFVPGTCGRGPG